MGRGRRTSSEVKPRAKPRGQPTLVKYRRRRGVEPVWGDFAARRYGETFSDALVADEIAQRYRVAVSAGQVGAYLKRRRDVVRRRKLLHERPYVHDAVSEELTDDRRRRLGFEYGVRLSDGEPADAVDDWLADEYARYSRAEHLCYTVDYVFTSPAVVAAMIRRLKKWHRGVGRPVSGEGFEDLLAGAWRDAGYDVALAPRNYDGADAHVNVVENLWVAMSLKSEGAESASKRTIHLSSVASHREALESPESCARAVSQARRHLLRYDLARMLSPLGREQEPEPHHDAPPDRTRARARSRLLDFTLTADETELPSGFDHPCTVAKGRSRHCLMSSGGAGAPCGRL